MGFRSCFVPGCPTGCGSTIRRNSILGIKNKSIFKATSESQLRKWRKAIPRHDKVLRPQDRVCELHFSPEDVLRYYTTIMPDGSTHKIERGVPYLKPDAVPTIFPNSSKYRPRKTRKRKKPMESIKELNTETEVQDSPAMDESIRKNTSDNLELLAELPSNPPAIPDGEVVVYNMSTLTRSLGSLKLPSPSWASAVLGSSVMFLYVDSNFLIEKTLVVLEDLSFKVILQREEMIIDGMKEIKCENDLLEVINVIDKLRVRQRITEGYRL